MGNLYLKVTPEQLTGAANSLSNSGTTIRNLTSSMTDLVNGLSSIWVGDAATAYTTKFNGLQDDISRINAKIQEHVSDLNEMASIYNRASADTADTANSLKSDVIT